MQVQHADCPFVLPVMRYIIPIEILAVGVNMQHDHWNPVRFSVTKLANVFYAKD